MEEVYECGGLVEQEVTVHQSKGITCGDRGRTFAQDFVSKVVKHDLLIQTAMNSLHLFYFLQLYLFIMTTDKSPGEAERKNTGTSISSYLYIVILQDRKSGDLSRAAMT